MHPTQPPPTVVIVGMGNRSSIYARESLKHPELFRVVGVVDVRPERVRQAQQLYRIPAEHCFSSVEELVRLPRLADAAINGTMDSLHVATSLPLLRKGYDLLLEKPFATCREEGEELVSCARQNGRRVMICHILRYAPFYRRLRELLQRGDIGSIINIQLTVQVSYHHQSVSFVRGRFATPDTGAAGMLLSKCSHDLDIMTWLMAGNRPVSVSSIGSLFQYRPEMAPPGAGTHCLTDCPVERECPYSARRLYLEHPQRWANNIWHDCARASFSAPNTPSTPNTPDIPDTPDTPDASDAPCIPSTPENISREEKERLLRDSSNRFGRCIYRCQPQIVDHQSVLVSFADGATGTLTMNGGASASRRHLRLTGTRGEIEGSFEDERFTVSLMDPDAPGGRRVEEIDVSGEQRGDPHGRGDEALVRDFIALLRGEETSPCRTTLEDSLVAHRLAFLAEESRQQGGKLMLF